MKCDKCTSKATFFEKDEGIERHFCLKHYCAYLDELDYEVIRDGLSDPHDYSDFDGGQFGENAWSGQSN